MSCLSLIKFPKYVFEWQIRDHNIYSNDPLTSNTCYAGSEMESCWKMYFYPRGNSCASNNYTSFKLIMVHGSQVKMSGTIHLIRQNETILSHNMHEKIYNENDSHDITNFVKCSDFCYPITIRCELNMPADKNILPYVKRTVDFNQVLTDIHSLLSNGKATDVTIISEDQQEYRAHKTMLVARSDVFAAMFESNMKESLEGKITISDMKGSDIEEMLQYMYSGNLVKWSSSLCMSLFVAGDKYKVNGLKEACSLYLQQNMSTDIAAKALTLADMHGDERLKEVALNFIKNNSKNVLETNEWELLVQEQHHLVKELILKMAQK